jgi:NADH:ubiquinone oxidoreductase subunit 6 (subunit J)
MAGMLQILTYLLAVYLVVKGIEVLQIGLASSRTDRTGPVTIGILTLIGCLIAALIFTTWQDSQAHSMNSQFKAP